MTRKEDRIIKACGKTTRIPKSLSSYMYTGVGYAADATEFRNTINGQPMDAEKIVKALNSNPSRNSIFRTYKQEANQIQIIAIDFCGNEDLIIIKEKA